MEAEPSCCKMDGPTKNNLHALDRSLAVIAAAAALHNATHHLEYSLNPILKTTTEQSTVGKPRAILCLDKLSENCERQAAFTTNKPHAKQDKSCTNKSCCTKLA